MISPDSALSSHEVARRLGVGLREAQRRIASGQIASLACDGRARVTQIALWRYMGIEAEMTALWLDHLARIDAAKPQTDAINKNNGL